MIPQKLVLTAFGAFRDEQVIDFTALEQERLYMICGPTGAGKTTIFDAITFALYGDASGDLRKSEQLKSDYASPEERCAVDYTFLINGKEYSVERSPQQLRRTRRGTDSMQNSTAVLRLPDGTEVVGPREVNERIRSLIGLDDEQFRKIVMLPQGEFRKFLEADSKSKQELFRKLFHTHLYDAFTDRLQAEAKSLREQVEQMQLLCQNDLQMLDVSHAEDLQTEVNRETPDYPTIEKALEQALEYDRNRFAKTQAESAQVEEDIRKLQIERAEETSQKLAQKEQLLISMQELEARSGEMQKLEQNIQFWQQAKELREFYQVWQTELQNRTLNQQLFLQLQAEQERLLKEEKIVNDQYQSAEMRSGQLPALQKETEQIQKQLEQLKRVEQYKAEIEQWNQQAEKYQSEKQILSQWNEWLLYRERYQKENRIVMQLQNAESNYKRFRTAAEAHLAAQSAWNCAFQQFWAGQAPKLAETLQENEPCPVCGSLTHPAPAMVKEGESILSQEQLEQAEQYFHQTTQQMEETRNRLLAEWSSLEEAGYLPPFTAELPANIFSEAILPFLEKSTEIKQHLDWLETQLSTAGISPQAEDDLTEKETSLLQKQAALEKALEIAHKNLADAQANLPANATTDASQKRLAEIEKESNAIAAALESAVLQRQQWSEKQENLRGRLSSVKQQEILSEERVIAAHQVFQKELKQRDFSDESDFLFWWESISNQATAQQQLQNYRQERHTNEGKLHQLQAELGDAKPYDLEALRQQYAVLQGQFQSLRETLFQLDRRIAKNTDAKQRMQKHWKRWQEMDKAFREVEHLNQITRGNNAQQLALERYVLAAYFDDIIESANIRLTTMTNGRYTLLRRTGREKGRRPSGLDLDIFDANTGKARHVDTLSGGESFKASLALAWGLADIISQYSGGVSIQTLFIDEGFGSLDAGALEGAVDCLFQIADSGKTIGIISHVEELKEKIPAKLLVVPGPSGSRISMEIQA